MDYKKEIIQRLNGLSGSRSPYEVFCDWVKCFALAIQNQCMIFRRDAVWEKREEQYIQAIRPYGESGKVFSEMSALLIQALGEEITDILGQIYMEAGLGNKNTGQFFTPFHGVSCACARILLTGEDGGRRVSMHEPSCGAGGMVIAAAVILKEKGIDYQRCLDVVAQDLDWKAVYMCYIQLSLLGIRAVVVQGNTLTEPYQKGRTDPERIFYTPKHMGMLL